MSKVPINVLCYFLLAIRLLENKTKTKDQNSSTKCEKTKKFTSAASFISFNEPNASNSIISLYRGIGFSASATTPYLILTRSLT